MFAKFGLLICNTQNPGKREINRRFHCSSVSPYKTGRAVARRNYTMEIADVNGGNAEVACESSNLETVEQPEKQTEEKIEESKEPEQEMNGDSADLSKTVGSPMRRTLRKTKANSTSTVEAVESDAKPKMKGCKRKHSDPDINSDDSLDFTGFDSRFDISDSGNLVLQKLIGN